MLRVIIALGIENGSIVKNIWKAVIKTVGKISPVEARRARLVLIRTKTETQFLVKGVGKKDRQRKSMKQKKNEKIIGESKQNEKRNKMKSKPKT